MNICKSVIAVVPETNLQYEIRIDLVKAKKLSTGDIGWHHLGMNHLAKDGTKVGEGRFIVTIQGVEFHQLEHGGCTHLVTKSRIAAVALFEAWHCWAMRENKLQETGDIRVVRKLPSHSLYWNL